MAWWHKPAPTPAPTPVRDRQPVAPNPHLNGRVRSNGFFSTDVNRFLAGWDTQSNAIDYYLEQELGAVRARSRRMVRASPYGKRFIDLIRSNVIGPSGINVQAQSMIARNGKSRLDTPANDAIEAAFKDWGQHHCDFGGRLTWVDMGNMAIATAAQDGEFIFRKRYSGKYGFQLQAVDPELLDRTVNEKTRNGGEIRLGVEYDDSGKVVAYWFREKERYTYLAGKRTRVVARHIIHGFIPEWPDQSRGIPWMHASLERSKHLEKYEEAAIVKARSTAATMAFIRSEPGEDAYKGDEDWDEEDGVTIDQYEAGTIKDIGSRLIENVDSNYPHQMYSAFVKSQLQGIASGLGISYHALANDLEGVNYSSIRAGVLEDREVFKGLQNWFIRQFVRPVYEEWLAYCWINQLILIGQRPLSRPMEEYMPAHYQGRRWAWVDPQKDGTANQMAIDGRLKSRSQVMREQGDDPESVWREIQHENEIMAALGVQPIVRTPHQVEGDASANESTE